jgi:hypothetical protein
MSFGAELVARALGLPELPWPRITRAIVVFLAFMTIAMPITFRHGVELYVQRESQQLMHTVVDPLLHQLQQQLTPRVPPTLPDQHAGGHTAIRP